MPNPFAQNLKRENNKVIAILLPDISHDFFAKVCRALEMLFYQNNYLVMICDTDDDPAKERFYIEEIAALAACSACGDWKGECDDGLSTETGSSFSLTASSNRIFASMG